MESYVKKVLFLYLLRQVPLQEEFTGVVSSLPEGGDHSVALSSHGSGDVAVIAYVFRFSKTFNCPDLKCAEDFSKALTNTNNIRS